ncbi:MAG: hypothetical protein MUQ26_07840, partial [Armatimonadetes bacterium]|nr:hypothetical protein [Armatimonadota bacterium]
MRKMSALRTFYRYLMREEALLLGVALVAIALKCGWDSREFAGAVGAALPDVENLVARVLDVPESRMVMPTHRGRHGRETKGFGGQILLSLGCLTSLFLPRSR